MFESPLAMETHWGGGRGVEMVIPLLKYPTYLESVIRVTINEFHLDNIEQQHMNS